MTNYMQVFEESYERIKEGRQDEKTFYLRFYNVFTAGSQEVADKFAGADLDKQAMLLRNSFRHMLSFFLNKGSSDYLEELAERHSTRGVDIAPRLYDIWLDSLMEVVAEFDPDFSDEIELAWRVVLAPGVAFMKFKHAH